MKIFIITILLAMVLFFGGCNVAQKKLEPKQPQTVTAVIDNTTAETVKDSEAKIKLVNQDRLYKSLNTISVASLVGSSICMIIFVATGSRAGVIGSVACLMSFIISIVASQYLKLLALLGLVGLILLVAYIVYLLIKNKSVITELIKSVQIAKENTDRETIRTKLNNLQSETTKEIVKKEKEKIL